MYARLNAKSGKKVAGKSYEIVTEALIGHGPECNLLLKSGVLSAKHARIFYDQRKGSYFLEDLKSYNGTRLDGKPVQGRVRLYRKHVITFANTFTFIFTVEPGQADDPLPPPLRDIPAEPKVTPHSPRKAVESGEPGIEVSPQQPPQPPQPVPEPQVESREHASENAFGIQEPLVKDRPGFGDQAEEVVPPALAPEPVESGQLQAAPPAPPPAQESRDAAPTVLIDESQLAELFGLPRFVLEFKNVRGEKSTVILKQGENTIGRLASSDVAVDDASISRNHALVIVRGGTVALRDLGSKNGTFVADKKIVSEVEILPDAPIRFGLVRATILKKGESPA